MEQTPTLLKRQKDTLKDFKRTLKRTYSENLSMMYIPILICIYYQPTVYEHTVYGFVL